MVLLILLLNGMFGRGLFSGLLAQMLPGQPSPAAMGAVMIADDTARDGKQPCAKSTLLWLIRGQIVKDALKNLGGHIVGGVGILYAVAHIVVHAGKSDY